MPRQIKKPALTLHKPTGRARVRIDGRDHDLGEFRTSQAQQRYEDLIAGWMARQDASRVVLTVDDLAFLYVQHADRYYRHPDETPTGEVVNIRIALRFLVAIHGRTLVRGFGPKALKTGRESMIRSGLCRKSINIHVGRIRSKRIPGGRRLVP